MTHAGFALSPTALDPLRNQMRGPLLEPGAPSWDRTRTIWNAAYEREPVAIARCLGAADVRAAVRFVAEGGHRFAVRSGGHDFAGNSLPDGGLMIDLSLMKGIRVDPLGRRARVEPGVVWGEFDHEAQAFGLATTGGTVSSVGVAGYSLGGGTGHLARSRGLSVDNVMSLDVVTAEGDLVRANEAEHPELFWALRGGGGNFGIVTSLEYRMHRVGPDILAGQVVHPFEGAREGLAFYQELMAGAPDELACYPFLMKAPPVEPFPEAHHGRTILIFVVAWVGDLDRGREVVEPILDFGTPLFGGVDPMPYAAAQTMFDAGMPKGTRRHSKAQFFGEIDAATIDTLLGWSEALEGEATAAYFEPQGGAINRVDPQATAYPHRDKAYSFHLVADWTDPTRDEAMREWAREFHNAMARHAMGGVYMNLMSHDEADRISDAYGANLARLARIKAKWDPGNLFCRNHNIEPG